jgi:uncharacterized membrane protein YjjP (DUF1212 family)
LVGLLSKASFHKNFGIEMVYVLEQRLRALSIAPDKARRVLVDVVRALLVPAFLPLLGWANWVIIPIAVIGLALGAMSSSNAGRNLNIVVVVIGTLRLMLGGGLF